jgi:hypothetical protein
MDENTGSKPCSRCGRYGSHVCTGVTIEQQERDRIRALSDAKCLDTLKIYSSSVRDGQWLKTEGLNLGIFLEEMAARFQRAIANPLIDLSKLSDDEIEETMPYAVKLLKSTIATPAYRLGFKEAAYRSAGRK